MINQIKLNLKMSRWIFIIAAVTLFINIIYIFFNVPGAEPLLNLLNWITIISLLMINLEVYRVLDQNESYRIYFSLPVKKISIVNADYLTYVIGLILTSIVFSTWMLATNALPLTYGLVMIIGVSLVINSIYQYLYSLRWFKVVSNAISIVYLIPILIVWMFYFMPLRNTVDMNLNLGSGWDFYLTKVPFIVITVGIIMLIVSYYSARKIVTETDID